MKGLVSAAGIMVGLGGTVFVYLAFSGGVPLGSGLLAGGCMCLLGALLLRGGSR